MNIVKIKTPLDNDQLRVLRAGDKVLISGIIYTARDKAHQLLVDMLKKGESIPFELQNAIIYYTGPVISGSTGKIISAGPTTSSRMDRYTPQLLSAGVKGLIGKGPRSREVIEAIRLNMGLYFTAVGGAGVYLAERIKESRILAFPELGLEGVYELHVEDLPCYVAIDSDGNTLFTSMNEEGRK